MNDFQVVYLTGAPASGKSSVAKLLEEQVKSLMVWDYGERLRQHVNARSGSEHSYDDVRGKSAHIITAEDVAAVDVALVEWVKQNRVKNHLIIDTHAVTKETFGFRVTPFSGARIQELSPTRVVVLYADPETIVSRIDAKGDGRLGVSVFEAGFHAGLQSSVAITYSILLGVPTYLLDTNQSLPDVAATLRRVAFKLGSS